MYRLGAIQILIIIIIKIEIRMQMSFPSFLHFDVLSLRCCAIFQIYLA